MKHPRKLVCLASSVALLAVCGGVGAQTAMKATNNESGCKIGYCPDQPHIDPCALEARKPPKGQPGRSVAPEPPARIVYQSSWAVSAPGIINYCVRIGVAASNSAWSSPLQLKVRDIRTGNQHKDEDWTNFSYPSSPSPTPYQRVPDRLATIATPISAGTSKFSTPICESNFNWYKRPSLAIENPLKRGEFCAVEFGPPTSPWSANTSSPTSPPKQ
jgi:hypothetical protein